MCYKWSR
jgi:hypothetical protein